MVPFADLSAQVALVKGLPSSVAFPVLKTWANAWVSRGRLHLPGFPLACRRFCGAPSESVGHLLVCDPFLSEVAKEAPDANITEIDWRLGLVGERSLFVTAMFRNENNFRVEQIQ